MIANETQTHKFEWIVSINSPKIIATIVGILSIFVTVIGNILVVLSFPMNRQLRSVVSNYFLLSLAIADLIIGVISMPFYVIHLIYDAWPLNAVLCDLWLAIDFTSSNSSATHLLLICLDRYLSITRPFTYRIRRTRRKAMYSCAIIWFYSILLWSVPIFLQRAISSETIPQGQCYVLFITNRPSLRILSIMIVFFIPTILMIILYSGIYIETRNRKKNLNELQAHRRENPTNTILESQGQISSKLNKDLTDLRQIATLKNARLGFRLSQNMENVIQPSSPVLHYENFSNELLLLRNNSVHSSGLQNVRDPLRVSAKRPKTNRRELKNEQKAARTLSAILFAFIMTWAPYSIYTLFFPPPTDLSIIFQLSYALCYLNSAFNPLLYAMCNENFRKTFQLLLTCKCRTPHPDANNGCVVNIHKNRTSRNFVGRRMVLK